MNDNRFDPNQQPHTDSFPEKAPVTPEVQESRLEMMDTIVPETAVNPTEPVQREAAVYTQPETAQAQSAEASAMENPVPPEAEPVQAETPHEPAGPSSLYDATPSAGMDYSEPSVHKDIRSGEYRVPNPIQTPIYHPEGASSMHQSQPYASQNIPPYQARPAQSSPYQQTPYSGAQQPRAYGSPVTPPVSPKKKKEKKDRKFGLGAMIGVACASALLCSVISSGVVGAVVLNSQNSPQTSLTSQNGGNKTVYVDSKTETSIKSIAEKVSPSVVGIRVSSNTNTFNPFGGSDSSVGEGSGVIYKQDGYIITNYHVISSAVESNSSSNRVNPYGIYGGGNRQNSLPTAQIEVFLPSDSENGIEATVVGYDVSADLAVLKIDKPGLPAIEIGDSDSISIGDTAVAIGNPGGLQFMGSVSTGIISGLNRTIQTESGTEMNLIQTDAAINPGNSGGALVNIGGQLIGINNSKMAGNGYEGMGFSIPVNEVVSICDRIINNQSEPQPYLGVTINQSYSSDMLQQMGYPAGVVVYSVAENSPAANAGIQANDIITAVNGNAVSSYAQLTSEKNKYSAGDTITVTVYRGGKTADLSVVLSSAN